MFRNVCSNSFCEMFPSAGRREAQEDTPTPWIGGGRRSSSVLVEQVRSRHTEREPAADWTQDAGE